MHQAYTIVDTRLENDRSRTLVFDRPLPAQPGQFVMAWLPGVDEKPFSIAGDDPLTLMVVAVGPFSSRLHELAAGDRVWIRGPLGQGFSLPASSSPGRLLLIGGGYGVVPLAFLAREAISVGHHVDVCIGARTATDILLVEQFAEAGAVVHTTTEDGTLGARGLVTEVSDTILRTSPPDVVYACGPGPMLEAVATQCRHYQVPHQLSWEAHMRCGMGLCGACEVHRHEPGWLACSDGPVSKHP